MIIPGLPRRTAEPPKAPGRVEIIAIRGLPEVAPGADLGSMIVDAANTMEIVIGEDDVIVVTQKIVSKSEHRVVQIDAKDPNSKLHTVNQEASRIVRRRGDLIIAETRHGFVCANAGVDASNLDEGSVALLPINPDRSARRIRKQIARLAGVSPAIIISDTFGRAWRTGQTNVAIGVAGMNPLIDYRGSTDQNGAPLRATVIAVADELAAAAELVMGKSEMVPVAVVRGSAYVKARGSARSLVRPSQEDLFR